MGKDTKPRLLAPRPVAVFAVDAKGKVNFWSAGMTDLTGKSAKEMIGKKAWTAFSSKKRVLPIDETLETLESAETTIQVNNPLTKQSRTLLFRTKPIKGEDDAILLIVALLLDDHTAAENAVREGRQSFICCYAFGDLADDELLTDEDSGIREWSPTLQQEAVLRSCTVPDFGKIYKTSNYASDDKKSRLAAIGEMTVKIVHDLRNPMTTIISLLETSADGLESGENLGEIVDDLRVVNSQARRIMQMVAELLVFARTGDEASRMELTNLRNFFSDTFSDLSLPSVSSKPSLICDLDLPADSCMKLDRTRIQRVLENLVNNACEAICSSTPVAANGKIWVKAAFRDDCLTVRVADNGGGIAPEMVDRIFEPFVSLGKRNGTGLGLATVQDLVHLHGGDVVVEHQSVEGGAAFTIRIPSVFPESV